jgi:predicted hydrocarbon binding protein
MSSEVEKEVFFETAWDRNRGIRYQTRTRAISMTTQTFSRIHKKVYELGGKDGLQVTFGDAGREAGEYIAKHLMEFWELKEKRALESYIKSFYAEIGWGFISEMDIDSGKVVLKNSFEAVGHEGSIEPICAFLERYFAGMFTAIKEKACGCREIKCIAKGDPYCEFRIEEVE